MCQVDPNGQGKFLTPFQARGYELLGVAFHEDRGPKGGARDQDRSPVLTDMGHLHELEH